MRFEVHIGTGNAAFEGGPGPELARILRELADKIEDGPVPENPIRLSDVNGNRVGFAVLVDDDPAAELEAELGPTVARLRAEREGGA